MLARVLRIEQDRGAGDAQQVLRAWHHGVVPQHPDALALCLRLEGFLVQARANVHGINLDGEQIASRYPVDHDLADELRARHDLVERAIAGDQAAVQQLAARRRH